MNPSRREILVGMMGTAAVALAAPRAQASAEPTIMPPLYGNPEAPKRLLVWGSLTCPFTAVLVPILTGIVDEMPKAVAAEWHHYPTHPPDPALMVAGLAFDGPHFWGFSSRILKVVFDAGGPYTGVTPAKVLEFAEAEGGSQEMLDAAYADEAKWAAVKTDLIAGRLLGVKATPGLFYRGFFLTPSGVPSHVAEFEKSLRAMLTQE